MRQALCCWSVTGAAQFWYQAIPCGIYRGHSDNGTVGFLVLWFSLVSIIPYMLPTNSFVCLMLYILVVDGVIMYDT